MKYKLIRKPGAPFEKVENALNEAAKKGYRLKFVDNGNYIMSRDHGDEKEGEDGPKDENRG